MITAFNQISLSGTILTISGTGTLQVGNQQVIYASQTGAFGSIINTGSFTGQFYPLNNNPSGYLTGFNSGQYITTGQTGSFFVNTGILTGVFYPLFGNPSGFILPTQTGQFASIVNLASTGNTLNIQVSNLSTNISSWTGASTGLFYPYHQNPSGYLTGFNSGIYITTGQTGAFASSVNTGSLTGAFYPLLSNPLGYITTGQTGSFSSSGNFYPLNTNPSGYITSGQTGTFFVNTGQLTGAFYPLNSNPSGYLTGFNSGIYITSGQTGQFLSSGATNILTIWSTPKINFTSTGSYNILSIPSNLMLLVDTMEVITTNISSPSQAPYVSFGYSGVTTGFVNTIKTTSNTTLNRHIFDNPQNPVNGTSINASIVTPSTAVLHSGYLIFKGFILNS